LKIRSLKAQHEMGQSIKGEPNHLPVNDGRKSMLGEVHCLQLWGEEGASRKVQKGTTNLILRRR